MGRAVRCGGMVCVCVCVCVCARGRQRRGVQRCAMRRHAVLKCTECVSRSRERRNVKPAHEPVTVAGCLAHARSHCDTHSIVHCLQRSPGDLDRASLHWKRVKMILLACCVSPALSSASARPVCHAL